MESGIQVQFKDELKQQSSIQWSISRDDIPSNSTGVLALKEKNGNHMFYLSHCDEKEIQVGFWKYGDFLIWTEKDWQLERITFDGQFFNECIEKSRRLLTNAILVEMLGKFYSQPRTTDVLKCPRNETLGKTYCYCEGPDDGPMIACDNEHCPYEWFHMKCLNLKQVPKRKKWFCPDCTLSKELNKLSKKR
eukprot:gene14493-16000_t